MKLLKIFFITILILSLASCGDESKQSQTAQSDETTSEQAEKYDAFARHGISGIAPAEYISCVQVAETDENAAVLLTEYEFTVKIISDPLLERQFYYNEILSYLKQTVKSGNVYKKTYNSTWDLYEFNPHPPFEDRVEENVVFECYFHLAGNEKLHKLTVTDTTTEAVHIYSLSLTTE